MRDLAKLDLKVGGAPERGSTEKRAEVRIASTGQFVAWFRSVTRPSDGEAVVSATAQFVRRKELTSEQLSAVEEWLREQFLAVI